MEVSNNQNIKINKIGYPSYNAVQINLHNPTANTAPPVIYDYPQADGQIYYPPAQPETRFGQENHVTRTPSGIEDYENYSEVDKNGQEIASIKYSKDGDNIVQTLKTKSPDGTTLEKTLKNSANFKSSNIVIKDKDGNILLNKEKCYKKFDDDNAQTVTNGEVYNISGLKGDVINIEHNGIKTQLDLKKMLNHDVKLLKMKTNPDNFDIRDKKITNEEKEKLFNRIKSLGGDDLIRLSKSVEHIQLLDEKSIESFFVAKGDTLLLSPKDWENTHMVTEHELGHAITHSGIKTQNSLLSDSEQFKNIREYEKTNFQQYGNMTKGDKLFGSKFLFGNSELAWSDGDEEGEESNLRDETFAECYNNLNNMDILHYDEEVMPMRTLSLFKYLPKTMVEAEKLSKIE